VEAVSAQGQMTVDEVKAAAEKIKPLSRGRGRKKPGEMNGTERDYAAFLDGQKILGNVEWWAFESVKFRLADKTFYTPDFIVMLTGGMIELREVKGGFWEDDARVKIKVAAAMYPFKFVAVRKLAKKHGGGWQTEEF
jgi:hypothetical protein